MGLFNSKKDKKRIEELEYKLDKTMTECEEIKHVLNDYLTRYNELKQQFPLEIGLVVYDVALRNEKGRYTKKNPSREHCLITEDIVTAKNYFNMVERWKSGDVYTSKQEAERYLNSICNN